jgi:hypothetical protein
LANGDAFDNEIDLILGRGSKGTAAVSSGIDRDPPSERCPEPAPRGGGPEEEEDRHYSKRTMRWPPCMIALMKKLPAC